MAAHAQQLGGVHEQKLQEGQGEVSKRLVEKAYYWLLKKTLLLINYVIFMYR